MIFIEVDFYRSDKRVLVIGFMVVFVTLRYVIMVE